MKIAYLVSRYPLVSHAFILREVLALRRAGQEVDTFTVRRAGEGHLLSEHDREADATTHALVPASPARLAGDHLRAALTRPHRYLSTLGLALSLRGRGPRALLWQLFYFGEAILMWAECRRRGIRHIHTHHANVAADVALLATHLGGADWSWSLTLHGPTELLDVGEHRLARKVELAGLVVCPSDYARSQLMGLTDPEHWGKLRIVRAGVDLSLWEPPAAREPGRRLLTVGRAAPAKGQPVLVDAIAELRRRGVDATLTIVGDGPLMAELEAQVARLELGDVVTLAGAVGQDRIRDHYREADLFVLPSFAEGLPNVLMEAMAMELPVVATWIAGIPELVDHGTTGLLVPPGRPEALADAIAEILGDGAGMGEAGRRRVAEEFELERSARELRALFSA